MATFQRPGGVIDIPGRVVIGGCGRTGAAIASALSMSNRTVVVVDLSQDAFDHLPNDAVQNGRIVPRIGDITLESDLRANGAPDAEVFIAAAGSDAVNIMAAQIARHMIMVGEVICRLDDPVKRDLYEGLDLTIVSHTEILRDLVLQRV